MMIDPVKKLERVLEEFRRKVPAEIGSETSSWDELRNLALIGGLRGSEIRSLSWKVFLGALSSEHPSMASWHAVLADKRAEYDRLVQRFLIDPRGSGEDDPVKNNPLAQAEDSKWSKYFELQELQKSISIDLERLNFDDEYFHRDTEKVQGVMLRILTVWSSVNPVISYRQGMHELLAPLLAVLDRDKIADVPSVKGEKGELAGVLDEKFVEHDGYILFERLMERIGGAFAPPSRPEKGKAPLRPAPVVQRCDRVQNRLLRARDVELCSHLQSCQVEPQLYGLRWIRLLLGREFHLEDVLLLWDAIFADQHGRAPPAGEAPEEDRCFPLLDHVCVAMLVYMREDLLSRDNIGCLRRLMKYPPVEDVRVFVSSALAQTNPDKAQLPLMTPPPPTSAPPAASPTLPRVDLSRDEAPPPPAPATNFLAPSPQPRVQALAPADSSPRALSDAALPPRAASALAVLDGILPPRSDPRRGAAEQALCDIRSMLAGTAARVGGGLGSGSGRLRGMAHEAAPAPATEGDAGEGGFQDVPLDGAEDAWAASLGSTTHESNGSKERRGLEAERRESERREAEARERSEKEREARERAEQAAREAKEERRAQEAREAEARAAAARAAEAAAKAAEARKASMAILLEPPSPASQQADAASKGGKGGLFSDSDGGKGSLFGDMDPGKGAGKKGGGLFGDDDDSEWLSVDRKPK